MEVGAGQRVRHGVALLLLSPDQQSVTPKAWRWVPTTRETVGMEWREEKREL